MSSTPSPKLQQIVDLFKKLGELTPTIMVYYLGMTPSTAEKWFRHVRELCREKKLDTDYAECFVMTPSKIILLKKGQ